MSTANRRRSLPAPPGRAVVLERNLQTIQQHRRRVLLAGIKARDVRLATAALAELGALSGAW